MKILHIPTGGLFSDGNRDVYLFLFRMHGSR